jgi:hypothetical protein
VKGSIRTSPKVSWETAAKDRGISKPSPVLSRRDFGLLSRGAGIVGL